MDPKRELSSIDLAALVTELDGYAGAKVDKTYLYGDDLLRLKLRDYDRGRVELLIEVGETKRAHVADPAHVEDAPGRPPNFAKMLRNRIAGGELVGVSQYEFDRILVFEFERPDQDTTIVAELFGQGNVAVLDEDDEVVSSLDTVRLRSRTVAPGEPYGYPESRLNPLRVSFRTFCTEMDASSSDVVRTLATRLNLGGLYAEEVCSRAEVPRERPIGEADEEDYRRLYQAIEELASQLRSGTVDPRVYLSDGRVVDVTPFPLDRRESQGLDSESFESFNAAVDSYFYRFDPAAGDDAGEDAPDFDAEIAKHQRIIDQQERAIENFEREATAEREKAELLYANYGLVDEILSTVQDAREDGVDWETIEETFAVGRERGIPAAEAIEGVDGSQGTITVRIDDTVVALDASVGVEKNADALYTEAKRIEEKMEGAMAAIEDTRAELERLRAEKQAWERGDRDDHGADEEDDTDEDDRDWLTMASVPVRRDEQWYERFRWFHTEDDFLVIGGRNADQNEELVKKYMEPYDRFFHTQAHGGPVTILKASGPSERSRAVEFPDRTLESAARFAVSYSSVWKDGRFAGDAYMVEPDQVSKTPESGEYIEKGGFVIRGDREYFRDVPVGVAIGIQCEPQTRVIGGPPEAIEAHAETAIELQPGRYAANDAAKLCYRAFRDRFADTTFVRKVASPDEIGQFLPPGGSELIDGIDR